jgi:TetR/AcrR family transcriptional repressor of nem operon
MGRPREFDLDEAVACATGAFLRAGYEGTSVADLLAAMGIEKGSLYKAFGDKRRLFLTALDRYLAAGLDRTRAVLARHADAREAVRAWLLGAARFCLGGTPGCLAVNATAELAPHDADIRKRLKAHWGRMKALLVEVLEAGQQAGTVRSDRPAGDLAEILLRVHLGMAVLARQGPQDAAPFVDTLVALVGG